MKDDKENKAKIETLSNVLRNLNAMNTSYQTIMADHSIDQESKKQVEMFFKRYISTYSPYIEDTSKSEIPGIQELLQSNKPTLDQIKDGIDKAAIETITKETIELDKSTASKQVVSYLNLPKLRTEITNQKALITHHMASCAVGVSELVDNTSRIIADDLAYVKQEYNKLTEGKDEAEIESNELAKSFKRLEGELTQRLDKLSKYKDNTSNLANLSDVEKEELSKITKDQAVRLKSLSTVLKDQATTLEERGNQLALFSSFLKHDQTKLADAARAIYGDKSQEFLSKMDEYKKGTDTVQNKQAMKDLIGLPPESLGTKDAAHISDSAYDINKAYNQQTSINIAPKEYLNQFYSSVIFNTTPFFHLDQVTKQKVFNSEEYSKWRKTVGVTETGRPEAGKKAELFSEKEFIQQSKSHKSKHTLTASEQQAIELFAKGRKNEYLSDLDKKLLASFFSYAAGNKELNQRLSGVLRSENEFVKTHQEEMAMLHKFTYKSSFHSHVVSTADKLDKVVTKLEENQDPKLKDKQKITLLELGEIKKYLDIQDVLEFVKNNQLNNESKKLQELLATTDKAEKAFTAYNNIIKDNTIYEDGDLVMDVAKRYHDMELHNKRGFKSKIADVITPYSHAAIGTQIGVEGQKIVSGISEVWREYRHDEISAQNGLISESFRIYPDKLIRDNAVRQEICKALGVNEVGLRDKMRDLYKNISKELNNPDALEAANIQNDRKKREKAGKADFIPFGHQGKQNVKKWATEALEDKQNLAHKIKDPKGNDFMICSEFAAKMTVLSLVEFEKGLIAQIQAKDPNFKVPKKGLLKMPFHKYEDLGKVHPAGLVKGLKNVNAIEKVARPKVVSNSVRFR